MSWTDDRVELLKKLWGEGKTASEIANILGDVTRNAVIGKAHRLKLSGRNSPIQSTAKKTIVHASNSNTNAETSATPTRGRPKKQPQDPIGDIPVKRIKLADLKDRQCRFPLGDPKDKDFSFCGCRAVPGIPYCMEHAHIAYQAATRKKIMAASATENETPASFEENSSLKNLNTKAG